MIRRSAATSCGSAVKGRLQGFLETPAMQSIHRHLYLRAELRGAFIHIQRVALELSKWNSHFLQLVVRVHGERPRRAPPCRPLGTTRTICWIDTKGRRNGSWTHDTKAPTRRRPPSSPRAKWADPRRGRHPRRHLEGDFEPL